MLPCFRHVLPSKMITSSFEWAFLNRWFLNGDGSEVFRPLLPLFSGEKITKFSSLFLNRLHNPGKGFLPRFSKPGRGFPILPFMAECCFVLSCCVILWQNTDFPIRILSKSRIDWNTWLIQKTKCMYSTYSCPTGFLTCQTVVYEWLSDWFTKRIKGRRLCLSHLERFSRPDYFLSGLVFHSRYMYFWAGLF